MHELGGVPVVAQGGEPAPTGNAEAVLRELARLLEALLATGEGGGVDLRSLPITPADREWLRRRLGRGEAEIRIEAGGTSRISETGVPGVWWLAHHDADGALIAELLEVAWVPEIVPAHPDDVRMGLARLREGGG